MKNPYLAFLRALEREKKTYRLVFYCHRTNTIKLVKTTYILLPSKAKWVRYYDGKTYGRDRPVKWCDSWCFMGVL
jgi:hypothetical protein